MSDKLRFALACVVIPCLIVVWLVTKPFAMLNEWAGSNFTT